MLTWRQSAATSVTKWCALAASLIALASFRRNTASCFAGTALISTSDMSGIEKPRWIETRFQRLVILGIIGFLERCPRLT